MKKIIVSILTTVFLLLFFTHCQKEEQIKEWISFKVQVNPVKMTGEGSGESQGMALLVNQTIQALESRFKLFKVNNIRITKVPDFNDQLMIEIPQKNIVVSRGKKKISISPFHMVAYLCAYPEYKIELKLCTKGPYPVREILLEYYNGKIPENMEIVSKKDVNGSVYYTVDQRGHFDRKVRL